MWQLLVTIFAASQALTNSQAPGVPILDRDYWLRNGKDDLEDALRVKANTGVAKNVILFIGDGMGPITVTASRIYNGGETSNLIWEKFEHVGLLKTYSNDRTVPDSANTASAMMNGIKSNMGTLGMDASVKFGDCPASLKRPLINSHALYAQEAGKATGVVTNTRITHATPAAVYAHTANRDWECEAKIPATGSACKDIARQLIEDDPGRKLNVIMGGGRQSLVSHSIAKPNDPLDHYGCKRMDSRNLIDEWISSKRNVTPNFAYVKNTGELSKLNTANLDYLMGIFSNTHLPFTYARDKTDQGTPSLELMTTTALKVLSRNPKGFFLMVEGGLIDQAHHRGRAKVALDEVVELNKAVNATVQFLEKHNIKEETLLIVTSDHCHTLSMNGYPPRGNSILGIAERSKFDGVNYTTLTYGISGKANLHYEIVNGTITRRDPSLDDTESWDYHQETAIVHDEGKHGGGDVNVYATGPMAHLFHRVHEQSYVGHVIQYAAQLGRYKDRSVINFSPSLSSSIIVVLSILCFTLL